jgi:hypothetical protein
VIGVIGALARPPLARLAHRPRAWIAIGAWGALALAFAIAARQQRAAHGADHVLVDTYGALVLPLLAYLIVGAALGSQSLRASIAPVVGFGAQPARAAAAAIGIAAALCGAIGGVLGAAVALVAHGISDPPLWRDAIVSFYAGALGGVAYAAWFSLGASFARRGMGRTGLLVVDWILGVTSGAGAAATPRGNLRNLLGGVPPMELSQGASAFALVGIAVVCVSGALLAVRRGPR